LASARGLVTQLEEPVLIVGAGQGLIVAEFRRRGLQCDGVDFSAAMIRQAKLRRGLELIQADARTMPFREATYGTIVYATGVIDFTGDEQLIHQILDEGRRVVRPSGKIFVAFYRLSDAQEAFLTRVRLLRENALSHRECLRIYLLNPVQMVKWVAKRAETGVLGAALLLFWVAARSTIREKATTLKMQKIFRHADAADRLIDAAPEKQPYRNETEIRGLFDRLGIPLKQIQPFPSCWIARLS
jgi:hypothetical protein